MKKEKYKSIILTFDDGPCEDTLEILKILKKYQVEATFFVLGRKIRGNEKIIKRVLQQGCKIGNHCYSHLYWTLTMFKSKKFWINEIKKTDEELSRLGIKTKFLRFPYLQHGLYGLSAAKELNKKVIGEDIGSLDWFYKNKKKVIKRVLKKASDGAIIGFHDYSENIGRNKNLPEILEIIIPELKKRGYKFLNL
jgi:peptidoglycan/xylan/chitin deacetylase (PgdA/CDA1 family)